MQEGRQKTDQEITLDRTESDNQRGVSVSKSHRENCSNDLKLCIRTIDNKRIIINKKAFLLAKGNSNPKNITTEKMLSDDGGFKKCRLFEFYYWTSLRKAFSGKWCIQSRAPRRRYDIPRRILAYDGFTLKCARDCSRGRTELASMFERKCLAVHDLQWNLQRCKNATLERIAALDWRVEGVAARSGEKCEELEASDSGLCLSR